MKRSSLLVLAAALTLSGFSGLSAEDWSRNDVIKFTPAVLQNYEKILDYGNIAVQTDCVTASANTNAWLQSYPIDIGADYVLSSAFISLEIPKLSRSYAVMEVRNGGSDAIIQKGKFFRSGKIDLQNVFQKSVTVKIELFGTDIRLLSYGLTRTPEIIITTNNLQIEPPVLFFNENILRIDFTLRYPAVLDVILFDRNGKIVDTIAKKRYFREGTNSLSWYPGKNSMTGKHQVYFKVVAIDGKEVELIKEFTFVKN